MLICYYLRFFTSYISFSRKHEASLFDIPGIGRVSFAKQEIETADGNRYALRRVSLGNDSDGGDDIADEDKDGAPAEMEVDPQASQVAESGDGGRGLAGGQPVADGGLQVADGGGNQGGNFQHPPKKAKKWKSEVKIVLFHCVEPFLCFEFHC